MSQIDILPLSRDPEGKLPPIHPVLLRGEREMLLVDCGCAGQLPLLEASLRAVGADPGRLTRVFITHHDHIGALAALTRAHPAVQVLASPTQTPCIEGREKSLRLAQAEALFPALPEAERPAARLFQRTLASVEPARGNRMTATPADAVIFTSRRAAGDSGCAEAAGRLARVAEGMPGYLAQSVRDPVGTGITVSSREALVAITAWRAHPAHEAARPQADAWYKSWSLPVCRVERTSAHPQQD